MIKIPPIRIDDIKGPQYLQLKLSIQAEIVRSPGTFDSISNQYNELPQYSRESRQQLYSQQYSLYDDQESTRNQIRERRFETQPKIQYENKRMNERTSQLATSQEISDEYQLKKLFEDNPDATSINSQTG